MTSCLILSRKAVDVIERDKPHAAKRRPKPITAQPVNENDRGGWTDLVTQLLGSGCRTPYNLAQRRLNALRLAAAALHQAGELSMREQATALADAVVLPPRD